MSKDGLGDVVAVLFFAALMTFFGVRFDNSLMLVIAFLSFVGAGSLGYFYRDPKRVPPGDPDAILAPADGIIIEIVKAHEAEFLEERVTKVSIFLSLCDVHINYVPYSGTVDYMRFNKGRFHRADTHQASRENTFIVIGVETVHGKMTIKQITGIMARRIVCHLRLGSRIMAGQKFGMIKFGSRVELYLPDWADVTVAEGDRVRAGESIVARAHG